MFSWPAESASGLSVADSVGRSQEFLAMDRFGNYSDPVVASTVKTPQFQDALLQSRQRTADWLGRLWLPANMPGVLMPVPGRAGLSGLCVLTDTCRMDRRQTGPRRE